LIPLLYNLLLYYYTNLLFTTREVNYED